MKIIIRRILLTIACLTILISISAAQEVRCPDYTKAKDGDINNDSKSDWFIDRTEDDFGNDVELWCIDPDGKQNTGIGEDSFDEYFAKLWSRHVNGVEEKYLVAWCPWEGGENTETILAAEEDGKIRYVGLIHISVDNATIKDEGLPGNDSREWIYNATTHNVTHKHYDRNGTEQPAETETKTPKKWQPPDNQSHQSYYDLPPYSTSFNWTGSAMVESIPFEFLVIIPTPPPANQHVGINDTSILNLVEQNCRNCHNAGVPDRHHNLVAIGEWNCNNCHPTQTGSNGHYALLDRNCLNCHNGTAFYANNIVNITRPHHINTTQARQRDCRYCHGSYVANYNDGHYIPTYSTGLVTPEPHYKIYNTTSGRYWGGCYACHQNYSATTPIILDQYGTHHDAIRGNRTGVGKQRDATPGSTCNWCHTVNVTGSPLGYPNELDFEFRNSSWQSDPANLTGCEQCHDIGTIHNIQYNYSRTQGKKGYGHIGENWDCNGCHAFWDAGDVSSFERAIIPDMTVITPSKLIAGVDTVVTITGNNFLSGIGAYTAVVSIDGTMLTPISITDNWMIVTIPGLETGIHTIQIVKTGDITDKLSKLASLVVVIPADITYANITNKTKAATDITISGTSFGPEPDPLFEDLGVWITTAKKGQPVKATIVSWTGSSIIARLKNAGIGDTVTVKTLNGEDTVKIQP